MAKWGKYLSIGKYSKYSNELSSKNGNSPYDATAATFAKYFTPLQGPVHRHQGLFIFIQFSAQITAIYILLYPLTIRKNMLLKSTTST